MRTRIRPLYVGGKPLLQYPAYLRRKDGSPKQPPPWAIHVFVCPDCGTCLERAEMFWVCPRSLSHAACRSDETIRELLAEQLAALGIKHRSAARTWYIQRRIQAWTKFMSIHGQNNKD